ncbi:very short patch repair endonuclease [Methylobacterium fujisawaense]|uniref:very short patch repair endonuclease n=1 Tax=Methylobacterium fujisawaense TaxID=107400 RepID=UPI002F2CC764
MPDHLTADERTALMRRVRRSGTEPELAVRRALRRLRVRYRINPPPLPGKPDLVMLSRRIAVFVHGCFWHQHPGCRRATLPSTRTDYWAAKFTRNVERDGESARALGRLGWTVLTVWECETRNPERLEETLRAALGLDMRC